MTQPSYESSFEVRKAEVESLLKDVGDIIGSALKKHAPGYGFTLMLFSYGEGGNMFYLSSADREDMIRAMDEFKQKFREN